MGMYTELVLSCNIYNEPEVIKVLQYMCDGSQPNPTTIPNHPLFEDGGRWQWMFRCSSHYHVPRNHASIEYNDIGRVWTLIVRCDFKNYNDEVSKFVDWIKPYVYTHGNEKQLIGYSLYEEDDEPKLLYVPLNKRDNE